MLRVSSRVRFSLSIRVVLLALHYFPPHYFRSIHSNVKRSVT